MSADSTSAAREQRAAAEAEQRYGSHGAQAASSRRIFEDGASWQRSQPRVVSEAAVEAALWVFDTAYRTAKGLPPESDRKVVRAALPHKGGLPQKPGLPAEWEECAACGLSLYETVDGARGRRATFKRFRAYRIARVTITDEQGVLLPTPRQPGDSHTTFWPYRHVEQVAFELLAENGDE